LYLFLQPGNFLIRFVDTLKDVIGLCIQGFQFAGDGIDLRLKIGVFLFTETLGLFFYLFYFRF